MPAPVLYEGVVSERILVHLVSKKQLDCQANDVWQRSYAFTDYQDCSPIRMILDFPHQRCGLTSVAETITDKEHIPTIVEIERISMTINQRRDVWQKRWMSDVPDPLAGP